VRAGSGATRLAANSHYHAVCSGDLVSISYLDLCLTDRCAVALAGSALGRRLQRSWSPVLGDSAICWRGGAI